jgi:hypothetical protein
MLPFRGVMAVPNRIDPVNEPAPAPAPAPEKDPGPRPGTITEPLLVLRQAQDERILPFRSC